VTTVTSTPVDVSPDPSSEVASRSEHLLAVPFVIVVGIFLGIPVAELAGFLPPPWHLFAQLATPWLVASFFAGYLSRRMPGGALSGISILIVGLVSQVAYKTVVYGGNSVRPEQEVAIYWALLAICLGAAMGAAGVVARSDRTWFRAFAWALPTTVATIEMLAISLGRLSYGWRIAVVIGVAAALLFVVGAARSRLLPMFAATATLLLCGFTVFTLLQRAVPMF
jgi:Family of unknown function (DUF6518)